MTKVNFYVNLADRRAFMVRLIRRVLAEGQQLFVHLADETAARRFDEWLWTFDEQAFIPHCLVTEAIAAETPIQIGWPESPVPEHHAVLLNLAPDVPAAFARFEKLLELVGTDDTDKQTGRQRYRFYKDRGYPLETFDMAERA